MRRTPLERSTPRRATGRCIRAPAGPPLRIHYLAVFTFGRFRFMRPPSTSRGGPSPRGGDGRFGGEEGAGEGVVAGGFGEGGETVAVLGAGDRGELGTELAELSPDPDALPPGQGHVLAQGRRRDALDAGEPPRRLSRGRRHRKPQRTRRPRFHPLPPTDAAPAAKAPSQSRKTAVSCSICACGAGALWARPFMFSLPNMHESVYSPRSRI